MWVSLPSCVAFALAGRTQLRTLSLNGFAWQHGLAIVTRCLAGLFVQPQNGAENANTLKSLRAQGRAREATFKSWAEGGERDASRILQTQSAQLKKLMDLREIAGRV